MPYETSYYLPDGTTLTIERGTTGRSPQPETWTRKGWIECCYNSAVRIISANLAVGTRGSLRDATRYDLNISEVVTDPARRYDLMSQALGLMESRDTREWITYNWRADGCNYPTRPLA